MCFPWLERDTSEQNQIVAVPDCRRTELLLLQEATKDIDIVLIVDTVTAELGKAFQTFRKGNKRKQIGNKGRK